MPDQAASLRPPAPVRPLPAIAVTGGKGGIGKTCIAVNLALHLARLGKRVLLVDFDLGLANADVMLGIDPQVTLADVIERRAKLEDAVIAAPLGLAFVPAASGVDALARLTADQVELLLQQMQRLSTSYDLLIIDTPAGIGREVVQAVTRSKVALVVTTPEPTALTDAYALIKVVEQASPGRDLRMLINQVQTNQEGAGVFAKLNAVAQKHLGRNLVALGAIPRDQAVANAVRRRLPLALDPASAESPANVALRTLALRLKGELWKA